MKRRKSPFWPPALDSSKLPPKLRECFLCPSREIVALVELTPKDMETNLYLGGTTSELRGFYGACCRTCHDLGVEEYTRRAQAKLYREVDERHRQAQAGRWS